MSPSKELPVKEADMVQQKGRSEREKRQSAPSEMISMAPSDGTPPGLVMGKGKKKFGAGPFGEEKWSGYVK